MRVPVRNAIVQNKRGERFRVLCIEKQNDFVGLIMINDEKALPFNCTWDKFTEDCESNLWKEYVGPEGGVAPQPSAASMAVAKNRLAKIQGITGDKRAYFRDTRNGMFKEHAQKVEAHPQQLRVWLRKYLQGGQSINALQPDFKKCGVEVGASKKETRTISRGRKPAENKLYMNPFFMPTEARNKFVNVVSDLFKKNRTWSALRIARKVWVDPMFAYTGEDGRLKIRPPGERPSVRQVEYAIAKMTTKKQRAIRKTNEDVYNNDNAPSNGGIHNEAIGVGHFYEIDSTTVDMWLVSEFNSWVVIGKATLYLVIDRFSRLVVGFHLSLDAPSWVNALEAVTTIFEDKKQLCERWGADYVEEAWPATGLAPANIVADRGTENTGYQSDTIVDGVNISVTNVPRTAARKKATVEFTFKTMNVSLKDHMMGYDLPAEQLRRRGGRYDLDARHTLKGLGKEVVRYITSHNLRPHVGMHRTPQQIMSGVEPTPVSMWHDDFKNSSGQFTPYNYDYIRSLLMERESAPITKNGIEFGNLYYTCGTAAKDGWFINTRGKAKAVKIRYDRRLVDNILVEIDGEFELGVLQPKCAEYLGMSRAEVDNVFKTAAAQLATLVEKRHQIDVQADLDAEDAAEEALRKYEAAKASKPKGKKNRNDTNGQHRSAEQRRRQVEEASRSFNAQPIALATAKDALAAPLEDEGLDEHSPATDLVYEAVQQCEAKIPNDAPLMPMPARNIKKYVMDNYDSY